MEKFILYVKINCPFCQKAESLLLEKQKNCIVVPFDAAEDVLSHMKFAYDHQTVPMVFHVEESGGMQFVGGYDSLVEFLDD